MRIITSILYYLFFLLSGIFLISVAFLLWIVSLPFDKRLYALHWFTQLWSSFLLAVVPGWKVRVIGREKIDNKRVKIFVSNHQSDFDIVAVSRLYAHFKWVSKSEVFKVPIIGWNMRMNRYIELKRSSKSSILRMIRQAGRVLASGSSVYIFPEGTRSIDGKIRRMSSGAFTIAKREKVGIQPIIINGTKDIMHKGDWKLNFKANVSVEVLDEIPYEVLENMEVSEITNYIKDLMCEKLSQERIRA